MSGGTQTVLSSQSKIDELFLQWLSLPEAEEYVRGLLTSIKKGKPIQPLSVKLTDKVVAVDALEGSMSPKNKQNTLSPPPAPPRASPGPAGSPT